MEVRVRGARASDAPAVSRLYYETVHRVNSRDYRPDQIAAWAPRVHPAEFWVRRWRRYRVLVAEVGGQVAGFAELGDEGHIACFYVHHAWQGRGVGSALLGRLVSESRRRGTAQLLADASLTAAPFFHRMGFRILRRQAPIYRNRRFKQYLMRRRLR